MRNVYKSQQLAVVAGGSYDIPLDFLPLVGRERGRLVLNRTIIKVHAICTMPAGNTIEREDVATLVDRLVMKDAEGERVNLSGREVKMKMFTDFPPAGHTPAEPDSFAAAATGTQDFYLTVFHRKPAFAERGEDYYFAVDDLLNGGSINVRLATAATVEYTTGAPTSVFNAGSYIQVWCYCDERHDLEFFARDEVKSYTFASSLEFMVPVNGQLLRELTWYENLATEAARLAGAYATMDSYSINAYDISAIPVYAAILGFAYEPDSKNFYDGGFPVLPLIWPGNRNKIPDQKNIPGQLFVRFDGASVAAASSFIVHSLAPKSPAMAANAAALAGKQAIDAMVKTAKAGSSRDARSFGSKARFMAAKQRS